MTARSLPALHLDRSPLVYVLAQVSFSALLNIERWVPDLQDRFRPLGLPRFDTQQIRSIEFGPSLRDSQVTQWIFADKERSIALVLTDRFLVVETNSYLAFDEFETKLRDVVTAFQDVTSVDVLERVGLRYVDLIRPGDGETLDTYLQPGLLGLDPDRFSPGYLRHLYRFESLTQTSATTQMRIRVQQNPDGTFLPPDLAQNQLRFKGIDTDAEETITMLDIDHFTVGDDAEDFSVDAVSERIWVLHEVTDRAFRAAVTMDALRIWGGNV